jgi:hypothetical protein
MVSLHLGSFAGCAKRLEEDGALRRKTSREVFRRHCLIVQRKAPVPEKPAARSLLLSFMCKVMKSSKLRRESSHKRKNSDMRSSLLLMSVAGFAIWGCAGGGGFESDSAGSEDSDSWLARQAGSRVQGAESEFKELMSDMPAETLVARTSGLAIAQENVLGSWLFRGYEHNRKNGVWAIGTARSSRAA